MFSYNDSLNSYYKKTGKNKEEVVRIFLSDEYDYIAKCDKNALEKEAYDELINLIIYEDIETVFDDFVSKKALIDLSLCILDKYIRRQIDHKELEIYIDSDINISYTVPSNDEEYVKYIKKLFPLQNILNLLTSDEIKQLWIRHKIYDVIVIELQDYV